MSLTLRMLRPSSRETPDLLAARLADLRAAGWSVRYDELAVDPSWTYTAASVPARVAALTAALSEPDTAAVLCARGGYGASDLLPHLPWQALSQLPPKLLVGFSDASALHSALYTKLGWPGLHGPMPATTLWAKDGVTTDTSTLLEHLASVAAGRDSHGSLPLSPVGPLAARRRQELTGTLFGGCLTVLTNLIATPFMPQSLAGHLVFFEDTGENPARLMRVFNQWLQTGLLGGAVGVIVGHLRGLGDKVPDNASFVLEQFAARCPLPVWHTPLIGHTSPNMPLGVGVPARLSDGVLAWHLPAWERAPTQLAASVSPFPDEASK